MAKSEIKYREIIDKTKQKWEKNQMMKKPHGVVCLEEGLSAGF